MRTKTVIRKFVETVGSLIPKLIPFDAYAQDGLLSIHNHDFMRDPSFCKAYERGAALLLTISGTGVFTSGYGLALLRANSLAILSSPSPPLNTNALSNEGRIAS